MEHNPSLGTFTLLPRELRDQIWECLSVQRRFANFQTSRQIYTEATQAFYNVQILQFHISPEYQYKSWLTLETNFDAKWPPRLLVLQSLSRALQQGFDKLPFEKLKKIQINVGAPDTADPGQIICLHKKCVDLAVLLEHAKHGLPDIEINLLDSASANADWWDYRPKTSMLYQLDLDLNNSETRNDIQDDQIVLYAFFHLRNARSAKISGPEQPQDYFYENVAQSLEEKEPFGTYPDTGDFWGDENLQEDRDQLFMHLDLDLDLLPGPTANMMRLDRFSSWYTNAFGSESRYEKEYERIIKTWTDYGLSSRRLWSLFRRFARMRASNPKSMERQYSRPLLLEMLSRAESGQLDSIDEASVSAHELGIIDDDWDQDAWHEAWPLGIPAFDTAEFGKAYCEGHDYNRSTHGRKFDKRIRGWLQGEDGRPAKRYLGKRHACQSDLDIKVCLYRYEYLPYDVNHPPIDTRETYGIRVKVY
ncbi:MAG: hypothetical protein Q9199_000082 [Rusavskia elegans]